MSGLSLSMVPQLSGHQPRSTHARSWSTEAWAGWRHGQVCGRWGGCRQRLVSCLWCSRHPLLRHPKQQQHALSAAERALDHGLTSSASLRH